MTWSTLKKSITVRAGAVAAVGLLCEIAGRALGRFDVVSADTASLLRYSGESVFALAMGVMVYGLRRALGGNESK